MSIISSSSSSALGFLGTAPVSTSYQISRSLRFNSSDSAYLSRTPSSSGNRRTWTWAGWVKKTVNGTVYDHLFSAYLAGNDNDILEFRFQNDTLVLAAWSYVIKQTSQVFRDTSAWGHVVLAVDTTQATANDRVKFYWNGVQVTAFSANNAPVQNTDLGVNTAALHQIGRDYANTVTFDGYLADVHFIDGQALDPSSFTEVSATTGQLIPKAYTGSYGTNGFRLPFSDNSAATSTTLGKDSAGSNNWTPNNFSVLFSYTDTFLSRKPDGTSWTNPTYAFDGTTANYADGTANNGTVSTIRFNKPLTGVTLLEYFYDGTSTYGYNSTDVGTGPNLTGGSWVTVYSGSAITVNNVRCTSQAGNGVVRLYAIRVNGTILNNWTEVDPPGCDSTVDTPTSYGTDTGAGGEVRGNYCTLNPLQKNTNLTISNGNLDAVGTASNQATYGTIGISSGKWYWEVTANGGMDIGIANASGITLTSYVGSTASSYAYDANGQKYTNGSGSAYGASFTTNDVIGVAFDADAGTLTFYKNGTSQGQAFSGLTSGPYFPAFSTATSSFSINFGQRSFAYQTAGTNRPASTFKALCDTNLTAPVVAKPNEVMDVALWTGNGGNQSITLPGGFNPDLVWIKSRSNPEDHYLFDAVRGGASVLLSNTTNAEVTGTTYLSFDTSGFSTLNGLSSNGYTYAAWTWDAGSSTVANTQGSISSQVRANASAGFSVVTYTGNDTAGATIGHGLGVAPQFVICKRRDAAEDWWVGHVSPGWTTGAYLQATNGFSATSNFRWWNDTAPTSSVITLGTYPNTNTGTYVCYAFAPVAGYSSFGSYTGNGDTSGNGPFVYLGFKPRFLMVKCSSSDQIGTADWVMIDTARDTYNLSGLGLRANLSNAEYDDRVVGAGYTSFDILSNGFKLKGASVRVNASGATYIYAAFAESPFQYARAR